MKIKRTYPVIETSVQQLLHAMDNNLSPLENFKTEVVAKTFSGTGPIRWDVTAGTTLKLKATNSGAFTLEVVGHEKLVTGNTIFIVDVENAVGGAMGTVTFSSTYFLTSGAFVSPANTKRRTIGFYYDGTKFIELFRVGADL